MFDRRLGKVERRTDTSPLVAVRSPGGHSKAKVGNEINGMRGGSPAFSRPTS